MAVALYNFEIELNWQGMCGKLAATSNNQS